MNITPVGYQCNYNAQQRKNTPSFGSIHFTDAARMRMTTILNVADFDTRNNIIQKLKILVKKAQNTRDILVDAPEYVIGLTAKVSKRKPVNEPYGIKTFIQEKLHDFKFLEDAVKESMDIVE